MIEPAEVREADRVLLAGIPAPETVAAIARQAARGLVVGLGETGPVAEARRAARDLANVMFMPLSEEPAPWQDGFFSLIVVVEEGAVPATEVRRLLAPGGRIWRR